MTQFPCIDCDTPIPTSEAARIEFCPVCSRSLSVCERFRLRALLSKSERDRVYSAVEGEIEVSVKILLTKADDRAARAEFERVAQALQSIHSPALPRILGWERGTHGRLILVREHFDGGTLAERHQIPPLRVLKSLLELLTTLHQQSPPVLHRDIRGEKILFRRKKEWSPVLVDFVPTGEATIAADLRALGAALSTSGEVAEKLAMGGFPSAAAALRAMHK